MIKNIFWGAFVGFHRNTQNYSFLVPNSWFCVILRGSLKKVGFLVKEELIHIWPFIGTKQIV